MHFNKLIHKLTCILLGERIVVIEQLKLGLLAVCDDGCCPRLFQDTLREDCDNSDNCSYNCCVNPFITPVYFVVFVLISQFVLVNVVVAVLMKHLEVSFCRVKHLSQWTRAEAVS